MKNSIHLKYCQSIANEGGMFEKVNLSKMCSNKEWLNYKKPFIKSSKIVRCF